jgi:hypothetical protein
MYSVGKASCLRASIQVRAGNSSGLQGNSGVFVYDSQARVQVQGDGNGSDFMSMILDDLASVHGQGSEEAKANASAQAAHHDLDLVSQSNLD